MKKYQKKYEAVAYKNLYNHGTLCLWREWGEGDAVQQVDSRDRIRVGYMDDAALPIKSPRPHYIYDALPNGRQYVKVGGRRHYLDDFLSM